MSLICLESYIERTPDREYIGVIEVVNHRESDLEQAKHLIDKHPLPTVAESRIQAQLVSLTKRLTSMGFEVQARHRFRSYA